MFDFQYIFVLPFLNCTTFTSSNNGKWVYFHHSFWIRSQWNHWTACSLPDRINHGQEILKIVQEFSCSYDRFYQMMKRICWHKTMPTFKILKCYCAVCDIRAIYIVYKGSIKRPILILRRAVVCPRSNPGILVISGTLYRHLHRFSQQYRRAR